MLLPVMYVFQQLFIVNPTAAQESALNVKATKLRLLMAFVSKRLTSAQVTIVKVNVIIAKVANLRYQMRSVYQLLPTARPIAIQECVSSVSAGKQ